MTTQRIFPCIKLFEIAIQTAFLHKSKNGISAENLLYSAVYIKNAGTQLLTNELTTAKDASAVSKEKKLNASQLIFVGPSKSSELDQAVTG